MHSAQIVLFDMLKEDIVWPRSFRYKTNSEWEPVGFFSEALCNSKEFDLLLGFFSSSAINVLSYSFASFIYNGGKMRMVINDILSSDDVNAISMARAETDLPYFDLRNLESLSYSLSNRDHHFFDCLAWLIRHGRIEIKIVRMINGEGVAHTKCGIFSDGVNTVGFEGSVNFSLSALIHNKESLSVSCDWNGQADKNRIDDINSSFERVFKGEDDELVFVDACDIEGYILGKASDKDIDQLLSDELRIIKSDINLRPSIKASLEKAERRTLETIKKIKEESVTESIPHFPYPSGPTDYQIEAFNNWKENGQKGFFAMATGTGKTATSLNCLLEIFKRNKYYKAIIVVPTISLVEQWAKECRKFGFSNIIKISSKSQSWKDAVAEIEVMEQFSVAKESINYIIIVTYASLAKPNVYKKIFNFPQNKLLFIADEAHNIGSNHLSKLLPKIPYKRRIGLSATPHRQYDENGNRQISSFFGFKDGNYTFSYSMEQAIMNNVLCRYYYYPHVVSLTNDELQQYLDLSSSIAKYLSRNGISFRDDPMLTSLLIKRKRIVHKAANKQIEFRRILSEYFEERGSLKYSLVYVPEGSAPDIDDEINDDLSDRDSDCSQLIDTYTSIIKNINSNVTVAKFTADTNNRNELLEMFASGKLDVLTSMKCLDEGVDVPRSEMAIFCASTGNPRQFIQRRGRILRTHKDKKYAIIHDLVVAPLADPNSASFNVERNLLRAELKRVKDFSMLSENPTATLMELTPILNHYNLNIYD